MSEYLCMKAVEYDKLPVKFKKANPFDGLLDQGYWLQKKYDGCMGIATIQANRSICGMLSRTGEDYSASTQHLLDELHEAATELYGQDFAAFVAIGEVWQPIEEAKFPAISGSFRRQKPSPQLRFVVNDLLPGGLNTQVAYCDRFSQIEELLPVLPGTMVTVAETWRTHAEGDMTAKESAMHWQSAGGFDGAVLRNPNAGYTVGTVKNGEIIKVKPVMSLDLHCNGVLQGEGKHEGKLGAISVNYNGVVSCVGTGFSDEDREFMWQGATRSSVGLFAPHNPIGKIVEIECLGITEDGKLREPRFKGIRHDKLKAD